MNGGEKSWLHVNPLPGVSKEGLSPSGDAKIAGKRAEGSGATADRPANTDKPSERAKTAERKGVERKDASTKGERDRYWQARRAELKKLVDKDNKKEATEQSIRKAAYFLKREEKMMKAAMKRPKG